MALEQGDFSTIQRYAMSDERREYGITRAKYEELFRNYIFPQFQQARPKYVRVLTTGAGILYTRKYEFYSGHEGILHLNVFRTPDGPRMFLLGDCVLTAMKAKFGARHKDAPVAKRTWRTLRDAIREDRATLESYGMLGLRGGNIGDKVHSWEVMLATYSKASE